MKFLESFDLFGGEWEKITGGKFHDSTKHMLHSEPTENERLKIERIFQTHFNPHNTYKNWPKIELWTKHGTEYYYTTMDVNEIIFIYSYEDEWYFIEKYNQETMVSKYYKCDGLEGIQKCLQDNFG